MPDRIEGARKYDLAVAYRIYPKVANPAIGLPFGDDKLRLSEVCLKSFRRSLGKLRVRIWVLLDGCPEPYADLFRSSFAAEDLTLISLTGIGNHATFLRQIQILSEQEDAELVYFAEDDYFYLPGQFHLISEFLRAYDDVDFVSPYDHLDCYTLDLHHKRKWLRVFGNHHWRTAASTCLTFLTSRKKLQEVKHLFGSYEKRNDECSIWLNLTKENLFRPLDFLRWTVQEPHLAKVLVKAWTFGLSQILLGRRQKLWVPVPGIATHMAAGLLSPGIDWEQIMKNEESRLGCRTL